MGVFLATIRGQFDLEDANRFNANTTEEEISVVIDCPPRHVLCGIMGVLQHGDLLSL